MKDDTTTRKLSGALAASMLLLGALAPAAQAGSMASLESAASGGAAASARFDGLRERRAAVAFEQAGEALASPIAPPKAARTRRFSSEGTISIPDIGGPPARTTGDYLVKGLLTVGIFAAAGGAAIAFFNPLGFALMGIGVLLILLADRLPTSK